MTDPKDSRQQANLQHARRHAPSQSAWERGRYAWNAEASASLPEPTPATAGGQTQSTRERTKRTSICPHAGDGPACIAPPPACIRNTGRCPSRLLARQEQSQRGRGKGGVGAPTREACSQPTNNSHLLTYLDNTITRFVQSGPREPDQRPSAAVRHASSWCAALRCPGGNLLRVLQPD